MKEQIKKMKQELKELAHRIKSQKKIRKQSHPHHDKYEGTEQMLGQLFRHKHIVYCLARGRKLEQIDSGRGVDMEFVEWQLNAMKPESTEKLYVVVNDKLSVSQQAVQSAHAVAEFLRKNPYTTWSNGYLVLLRDKPDYNGNMYCYGKVKWNKLNQYAEFIEPDVGNKVTAYACYGPNASVDMKSKALL